MVETFRPVSLTEALEIHRRGAVPFAGGTDLMVRYRAKNGLNPTVPGPVMFVDAVKELREVRRDGDDLLIGAAVPLAVAADDPGQRAVYAVRENLDEADLNAIPELLRAAAADLGAPGLRHRATVAGNVANASPAGDTVAALYALDAWVELASLGGSRSLPIAEFIAGPGRTLLAADELITALRLPVAAAGEGSGEWTYWRKVGTRRANALTKVSLAARVRMDAGRIASAAFAFGAVGPTVVRAGDAENLLKGRNPEEFAQEVLRNPATIGGELKTALVDCITPIDDQRSTAVYRKTVAVNLIRDAVRLLAQYIREKTRD